MKNLQKELKSAYNSADYVVAIDSNDAIYLSDEKKWQAVAEISKRTSMDFFQWLIRVAQIEVVDAKYTIECYGFQDTDGLVTVMTLEELYEKFIASQTTGEAKISNPL